MKKVLIAMNGKKPDVAAIRFACYICKLTHSKLTGVFLNDIIVAEEVVIDQSMDETLITGAVSLTHPDADEAQQIELSMLMFRDILEEEGIEGVIELDEGVPASDILSQTRYADILILDAQLSFSGLSETAPTRFVKDILHDAECPVLITPAHFHGIDTTVFCFHGTKSSLFSIKLFTYLLPQLRHRTARVLDLSAGAGEDERLELLDYLNYHYSEVEFLDAGADALPALFNYIQEKGTDIVVIGAYGRGLLESFFEPDTGAGERVNELPIFVAHY